MSTITQSNQQKFEIASYDPTQNHLKLNLESHTEASLTSYIKKMLDEHEQNARHTHARYLVLGASLKAFGEVFCKKNSRGQFIFCDLIRVLNSDIPEHTLRRCTACFITWKILDDAGLKISPRLPEHHLRTLAGAKKKVADVWRKATGNNPEKIPKIEELKDTLHSLCPEKKKKKKKRSENSIVAAGLLEKMLAAPDKAPADLLARLVELITPVIFRRALLREIKKVTDKKHAQKRQKTDQSFPLNWPEHIGLPVQLKENFNQAG